MDKRIIIGLALINAVHAKTIIVKELEDVDKAIDILANSCGKLTYPELVSIKILLTNYMVLLYKTQNKKWWQFWKP